MKNLLKLSLALQLLTLSAGATTPSPVDKKSSALRKSTRIVFTEDQVPQFVAVRRNGKTLVVIDSNRPKSSLEIK